MNELDLERYGFYLEGSNYYVFEDEELNPEPCGYINITNDAYDLAPILHNILDQIPELDNCYVDIFYNNYFWYDDEKRVVCNECFDYGEIMERLNYYKSLEA